MTIRHGQIKITKSTIPNNKISPKNQGNNEISIMPYQEKTCYYCKNLIICKSDELTCLNDYCPLVAHVNCLANAFLDKEKGHYLPIGGDCPVCERNYLWNLLLLKQKDKVYDLDNLDGAGENEKFIDYDYDGDLSVQPELYFQDVLDT